MSGAGEKTEKATPKRKQKARQDGQVAKSQDLNSAIVLIVGFTLLFVMGSFMYMELTNILIGKLSKLNVDEITMEGIIPFFIAHIITVAKLLAPLLFGLMFFGVISNLSQVGPLFTTKPLKPNPTKLNPINGFKRIFSLKGIVELIKGILKVVIIGGVGFATIYSQRGKLISLSGVDINASMQILYETIFAISWKVCIILLVVGLIDYFYQKYEFEKSIKMTKQDVKDEFKNMEGNPQIKRKVKSIQMQMAQTRMMGKVPEADVIVTNPTHFAIALKYDPNTAPAPIVIAKGVDNIAKKIKEIAKEHKVPIVENKPLARSLYKLVDLDHMVPEELFVAVAEVLAYVYKKNKNRKKKKEPTKANTRKRRRRISVN
jgi:flagellar biosynthetic protein FlhB